MADTGATSCQSVIEEAFGSVAWSNLSNAAGSNNSYATATNAAINYQTKLIAGYNFGFAIPGDATIDGVLFEIEWKSQFLASVLNSEAYLTKDVTNYFNSYGYTAFSATIPTTEAYQSCGGSSNLWNTTLTPAEVNATNFGIGVAVQNGTGPFNGTGNNVVSVDDIRATVYYTEGGGGGAASRLTRSKLLKPVALFG